jgi:curved DNA-binding protein CbpA
VGVPNEIPDFGDSGQKLRPNPKFDPTKRPITSEDYFVLSRVDGSSSIRDLILMSGFAYEKTVDILRKLRRLGALMLPGETPEQVSARAAELERAAQEQAKADQAASVEVTDLSAEEAAAMAEDVALSDEHKRRVIACMRTLRSGNYFDLLGVEMSADKRTLKRAYFRFSKDFHPDRFYNKETGSFGPWLAAIFEAANKAYDVLSDPARRERYEAALRGEPAPAAKPRRQSKKEHAAQLFERACGHEVRGELEEALKVFAAVIRVHATARYYRRASACAISAQKMDIAEEYAKAAVEMEPEDPSYSRALADVFFASGMLERAQQTLEHALTLKTENDVLAGEIQADLERVRRSLTAQ